MTGTLAGGAAGLCYNEADDARAVGRCAVPYG